MSNLDMATLPIHLAQVDLRIGFDIKSAAFDIERFAVNSSLSTFGFSDIKGTVNFGVKFWC